MTNIDQFESVFKAADKPHFARETWQLATVLVITTLDAAESQDFQQRVQTFLGPAPDGPLDFRLVADADFTEVSQLLALVDEAKPDLICTYRNLKRPAHDYPYSLGVFVDVLTQATHVPVLLLPTLGEMRRRERPLESRRQVLAITDHLTGDHRLVSIAAQLTQPEGTLWLVHVEDEGTFERYIETISKIPAIDTDVARQSILEQLLQEPRDYAASCKEVLTNNAEHISVDELILLGHRLADYKQIVERHDVELVVMNTKDEDQLAMHGVAYPLAIELRATPLLLV